MGAIALPCNTQLRRGDLEHRVAATDPAICIGEDALLAELPDGVPRMNLDEVWPALDEDRAQEHPVEPADLDPEDGALIVFTSGTTGKPRGVLHAQRYLPGQESQARHWLGAEDGELVWCTTATGWSKSARNVFLAPWLCGAAALLHRGPLRRGRAPRALRARGRQRALPGADRVPHPRQAGARPAGPLAAAGGLRRRGARPRGDRRLARARRRRDLRRLRPDRDRPRHRQPRGRAGPRRLDGPAAPRLRGARDGDEPGEPGELQVRAASCPTFFGRYLGSKTRPSCSRASGGRPATSCAPTTMATSGTRAAPTT